MTRGVLPSFRTADPQRRAFFITYGAGHVAKVAPVVRELERRGVECLVMALTIGHRTACQLGLPAYGYRDFLTLLKDPEQTLARGRALAEENFHPEVDVHESHCYLGINYQELVDEYGEAAALARYAESGRQSFMPLCFMGLVIDALQPGVVVATSTPRSEEAGVRAAHARGIPTLTMVDLFAPPSDPFLRRPVHAKRITVVSKEVRDRFLAAGLGAEQVVVTGSPDFDDLFTPRAAEASVALRQRLGWAGLHVVMWAGILERTGGDVPAEYQGAGLPRLVEQRLRAWVAAHPGTALIVRYHPAHYHHFPEQPSQERVCVSDPANEAILGLLHASDTVVHQVSTVGFQAALLKKRVLHIAFSGWAQHLDFDLSSLGPNESVDALDDLVPLLNSGARGPSVRNMTVPEGPAAPRVADQLMFLLRVRK